MATPPTHCRTLGNPFCHNTWDPTTLWLANVYITGQPLSIGLLLSPLTAACNALGRLQQVLVRERSCNNISYLQACFESPAPVISAGVPQLSASVCHVETQVCWTWCWFFELAALALFMLYRMGAIKVKELRRDLHEERYLVGRQLNNLIRAHSIVAPVEGEARVTASRSG